MNEHFLPDTHSGLITTTQTLDREKKDSYTLVLLVTDRGEPAQQSTRIVNVIVTDVDDHKPHFERNLVSLKQCINSNNTKVTKIILMSEWFLQDDPPILMAVEEEVPIGTTIGILKAIDEDIGENAAIDYAITTGNEFGLVKLKRTNDSKALIITAARFDRETMSKLLLSVKCFKYGTKPRMRKVYNRLVSI